MKCPECESDNYWRVVKDDYPYELVWKCSECGHEDAMISVEGFKNGSLADFNNMRAGLIAYLTLNTPEEVEYLILIDDNSLGFVIRKKVNP